MDELEVLEFYCSECHMKSMIGIGDLIPGRERPGKQDEFLVFHAVCPNCRAVSMYENCSSGKTPLIPEEMKVKIMENCAGFADEFLAFKRAQYKARKANAEAELRWNQAVEAQGKVTDKNVLYPGWPSHDEVVTNLRRIMKPAGTRRGRK